MRKNGLLNDLLTISRENQTEDIELVKKTTKKSKNQTVLLDESNSIATKLLDVYSQIDLHLSKYKDNVDVIETEEQLKQFIDLAIKNGYVAIDTETAKGELGDTALDPISCVLAGVCLYTTGSKSLYLPVNHLDYKTNQRLATQLPIDIIKEQLNRLKDIKQIYHNAKYDLRVLDWQLGLKFKAYWDTLIASYLIDENESHALKELVAVHIDHKDGKDYDFSSLFKSVNYLYVEPKKAALYAATDAYVTYELYEWQKTIINTQEFEEVKNVFFDIEMPTITALEDLEDNGICFDMKLQKELSEKYHKLQDEAYNEFLEKMETYKDKCQAYRVSMGIKNKLQDPVNINSPAQLAILFYDILELPDNLNKKKLRSTDKTTLEIIFKKYDVPVISAIRKYKTVNKLLSTYIDKLPNCISKITNRLHSSFNQ